MVRILAVDDVPENVFILQTDLEDEGYEVLAAYDGDEALALVRKESPDLMLLDVNMPGLSGLEVCEIMKADEATKNIPIILVSANSLNDDVARGLDCGAHDYIVKPYQLEVLMARVRSALRLKQAQDELVIAYAQLQKANEILNTMATVDPLTSLGNRRYFLERFSVELARAWRDKTALSFLMIDIDFFKAVNDQYGHLCGDKVLECVAKSFLKAVRTVDVVGRIGGEEFAVCCPKSSANEVIVLAERLRNAVAALRINFEGNSISVTVSIGVTELTPEDTQTKDLYQRADRALYQAKEQGRNRVVQTVAQTIN